MNEQHREMDDVYLPLADYHPGEKTEDVQRRGRELVTELRNNGKALEAQDGHLYWEDEASGKLLDELDRIEATLYYRATTLPPYERGNQ